MKIIDKRQENITTFANVPVGGVFNFLDEEGLEMGPYMRINAIFNEERNTLNAVGLANACLASAKDDETVILFNAEVIIN